MKSNKKKLEYIVLLIFGVINCNSCLAERHDSIKVIVCKDCVVYQLETPYDITPISFDEGVIETDTLSIRNEKERLEILQAVKNLSLTKDNPLGFNVREK
ncbi:MAG: hypothetical protein LKG25_09390 [Prevotella sp.]|jgi:hypothetical protein|nr:hypothetical protein [Prevotella sp.]MCI1282789.1 hypothetical protein [Prevotella sp.]